MSQDGIFGEVHVPTPNSARASTLISLDITYPAALKVAVVERPQVKHLGEEWADAGVYLLLDRPSPDGSWGAYVGKSAAAGGVKGRLRLHLRDPGKSSWYRAVAVCPAEGGWDEAEVAWLEGQVHRALQGLPGVSLSNTQAPGSGRLAPRRQMPLLTVSVILTGVLALIGHPVAGGDTQDESPPKPRGPQRTAGLSRLGRLADLLEAELLTSGARLVTRDPRWPGEGVVTSEGWIDVAGEAYWSPSGAAKALSGRKAEAGWDFWAVESADGPTLNELRARLTPGAASPPTPETHQGNLTSGGLARRGKLVDLLQAGLLASGDKLVTLDQRWPGEGVVTAEGWIDVAGEAYWSPSGAAKALSGRKAEAGWDFWAVESSDGPTLNELRARLTSGSTTPPSSDTHQGNVPAEAAGS